MALITRARLNQYLETVTGGTQESDMWIQEVPDFMGLIAHNQSDTVKAVGETFTTYSKNKIVSGDSDLVPQTVVVSGAHNNSVVSIALSTNHGDRLQQWQQLKNTVTGELFLVTAVPAASSITVATRGSRGTSAAAIADLQTLVVLPPTIPEGVDTPRSPMSQGSTYNNFMMIIEYSWSLSHRARTLKTFEFADDRFNAELKRFMTEATIQWGKQLLHGTAIEGDGGGTNPGSTSGLFANSTTRQTDFLGAPMTPGGIMDQFQIMFDDVGAEQIGKEAWGNLKTKRIWNSVMGSNVVKMREGNDRKSSVPIDTYVTDLGEIDFRINRDMPDGELVIWNPKKDVTQLAWEGGKWSSGVYATQGWYDTGFLRADLGTRWNSPRYRSRYTNFSYDLNDYDMVDYPR